MNAYDVAANLKKVGVPDITKLGCVMLDVEPMDVTEYVPEHMEYRTTNPDRYWIKGRDGGDHLTLLYGLLQNANTWRKHVDAVMAGWEMPTVVVIEHVDSFPSTFPDEPYSCIVGKVLVTPAIQEAHDRLSMLPHIDTHWGYKAHVTLAYVKQEYRQDAIDLLEMAFPAGLGVRGLNYGRLSGK